MTDQHPKAADDNAKDGGDGIDESKLEELWRKGAKAWADVDDSVHWVERIRGNAKDAGRSSGTMIKAARESYENHDESYGYDKRTFLNAFYCGAMWVMEQNTRTEPDHIPDATKMVQAEHSLEEEIRTRLATETVLGDPKNWRTFISNTPRTECYILNPIPECVAADFARELERELAAVRYELEIKKQEERDLDLCGKTPSYFVELVKEMRCIAMEADDELAYAEDFTKGESSDLITLARKHLSKLLKQTEGFS